MSKSRVQVITTIKPGSKEYSLSYDISDEFSLYKIKNLISLCEHTIMQSYCKHLGLSGVFNGHWLPSSRSTNITFDRCSIDVVKETAEAICNIIDAETVEEITIDTRFVLI